MLHLASLQETVLLLKVVFVLVPPLVSAAIGPAHCPAPKLWLYNWKKEIDLKSCMLSLHNLHKHWLYGMC